MNKDNKYSIFYYSLLLRLVNFVSTLMNELSLFFFKAIYSRTCCASAFTNVWNLSFIILWCEFQQRIKSMCNNILSRNSSNFCFRSPNIRNRNDWNQIKTHELFLICLYEQWSRKTKKTEFEHLFKGANRAQFHIHIYYL